MNFFVKMLGFVSCVLIGSAVHAQTKLVSGTVNAKLVLTSGCAINAGGGSVGTTTNFGALDFGTQPSGFSGSLSAQATGSGTTPSSTQITCSPDVTSVKVTIDGGQNAGKGTAVGAGTRALANGSAYVPYEVYSDVAHANQYVANAAQTVSLTSPGTALALPIYGVVNKTSTSALAAGAYTDVLNVTVGW
ncbi:Csu type fimbrial protein [Burkholderia lata]|uniref:Spore coat protein U domain-contain protein n=1 Tax=Burkholderia lata (strain ATCC 17760 / DSM 23089 / LMG 22485 / NCIMB 9086 / R18194 / 383) TaxID=482957 RepID=A0A6P2WPV0_BURL3|nr:spore coat protein U domain-containing protein [Burkholderia lata]VWC98714.1 spore coat protein U domain-contain protein [Burkholderia lata]